MRRIQLDKEDREFVIQSWTYMDYSSRRGTYEEYYEGFRDYQNLLLRIKRKYEIDSNISIHRVDWVGGFLVVEDYQYGDI
jgi:hypothetical protein